MIPLFYFILFFFRLALYEPKASNQIKIISKSLDENNSPDTRILWLGTRNNRNQRYRNRFKVTFQAYCDQTRKMFPFPDFSPVLWKLQKPNTNYHHHAHPSIQELKWSYTRCVQKQREFVNFAGLKRPIVKTFFLLCRYTCSSSILKILAVFIVGLACGSH